MQNTAKQLGVYPGLVAYYDTQPGNEVGIHNAPKPTRDTKQERYLKINGKWCRLFKHITVMSFSVHMYRQRIHR